MGRNSLAVTLIVLGTGFSFLHDGYGDDFLESKLKCSTTCLATIAGDAKPTDRQNVLSDHNFVVDTEYKRLVEQWEARDTQREFIQLAPWEVPASFGDDVVTDLLPQAGGILFGVIEAGVDGVIKEQNTIEARILKTGLLALEDNPGKKSAFDSASDGSTRLEMVEAALRTTGALANDEGLFDKISDPQQQNELRQSATHYLTTSLSELTSTQVTSANKSDVVDLRDRVSRLSSQVNNLRKILREAETQTEAIQSTIARAQTGGNETSKDKLDEEKKAAIKQYRDFARDAKTQLDTASGIFTQLNLPELAAGMTFASRASQVLSGVALCSIGDTTAILPTILGALQIMKGGASVDPVMQQLNVVIALQKRILEKLKEIEDLIKRNQEETMRAISVLNFNLGQIYTFLQQDRRYQLDVCTYLLNKHAYAGDWFLKSFQNPRFEVYAQFYEHASQNNQSIKPCLDAIQTTYNNNTPGFNQVLILPPLESTPSVQNGGDDQQKEDEERTIHQYLIDLNKSNYKFLDEFVNSTKWMEYLTRPAFSYHDLALSIRNVRDEDQQDFVKSLETTLDTTAVARYTGYVVGMHFYFEFTLDNKILEANELLQKGVTGTLGQSCLTKGRFLSDSAFAQEYLYSGIPLVPFAYDALFSHDAKETVCTNWENSGLYPIAKGSFQCPGNDQGNKSPQVYLNNVSQSMVHDGLLEANPLLRRNLALYVVVSRLREMKNSTLAYWVAYAGHPDPSLMKKVLGNDLDIRWVSQSDNFGWYLVVKGQMPNKNTNPAVWTDIEILLPMPEPDAVLSEKFDIQPIILTLQNVRVALGHELEGYNIWNDLAPQDQKNAKRLMIIGASPF